MILACADGGLICGPILVGLAVTSFLGWLGLRKKPAAEPHDHSACDHEHESHS